MTRYDSQIPHDNGYRYDVVVCRRSGHAVVWKLEERITSGEAKAVIESILRIGFIDRRQYYVDVVEAGK